MFHSTSEKYTQDIKVVEIIGEGLVSLIEKGDLENPELIALLQTYLDPMLKARIDYLVLGCSHYPYLIPILRKLLPEHIQIIDSGEAVAKQTKNILEFNQLLNTTNQNSSHQIFTNGNLEVLNYFINSFRKSVNNNKHCLLYTSPSPRDQRGSRMPSSA